MTTRPTVLPERAPDKVPAYLRLIRSYPFGLLWASQAISEFGSSFTRMALFLLAASRGKGAGGTAATLGLILAAQMVPPLLLGPFGGPLIDRSDRKRLMVVVDLARAACVGFLLLEPGLTGVVGLVFAHSTLSVLFGPARGSVIPEIVAKEDLMTATSLWQVSSQGLGLLGPAVAGVLVAAFGLRAAFVVDASSFLVSALTLAALRLPRLAEGRRRVTVRSYLDDLGQGFRYVIRTRKVLFYMASLFYVMLAGGIFNVVAAVYALDVAGLSQSQFGLVTAANGVGAITAAFLVGKYGGRVPKSLLFVSSVGLLGVCLGLYALRPGFGGLAALAFADNGLCVAALIPAQASLYETVDRDFRGRTFALFGAALSAAPLPGYFLAGPIAAVVPPSVILGLCGAAVAVGAVVMAAKRPREPVVPGAALGPSEAS